MNIEQHLAEIDARCEQFLSFTWEEMNNMLALVRKRGEALEYIRDHNAVTASIADAVHEALTYNPFSDVG